MTTDLSTALAGFDLSAIAVQVQEAEAIRAQVLDKFPLEGWPEMPLEEYALGVSDEGDSFCNWMELKSRALGSISGGSSGNMIIYKRKDGSGWFYPPGFVDENAAWGAIRDEFVKAFQLAKAGSWEAIDQLPHVSKKSILLKALHLYFPEQIVPVYSLNHLQHFLSRLGVSQHELNSNGRVMLNRRLLTILRQQPQCAGWSGIQLMRFLYHWAPLPTPTKPSAEAENGEDIGFASPFDAMFADEDDANWAFDFLADTARRLGVTNGTDPRAAFSLPRTGKRYRLRFIFGNWVIADVNCADGRIFGVGLTLPRRTYADATETFKFKAFSGEMPFSHYDVVINKARPLVPELQSALEEGLSFLADRMKSWRTPSHGNERPELGRAILDHSLRASFLQTPLESASPTQLEAIAPSATCRYWKIAPGKQAWQWEECQREGFIGIGWDEIGDMGGLTHDELVARWNQVAPTQPTWGRGGLSMLSAFAQIQPGDRIVANRGMREVVGIGTVTGGYYYELEGEQRHRLRVRWDDTRPRPVDKPGWVSTLIELKESEFKDIASQGPKLQPEFTLEQCAAALSMNVNELTAWVRAIRRKGQAVLYGPPGTGKTYAARHLAKHLVGGGDGFVELVQFHPAYAYEDFMQGIRPQSRDDGGLHYPLVKGRFLEFCERARARSGACVLIVDEINRANLARVFGELMYLLEYRDEEVPLAGGGALKIPQNVFLLGTMNTADRSIALVDHALRRRFAFIALRPNFEVLRRFHATTGFAPDGLINVLQRLNAQIGDPNYAVGVSFFMCQNLRDDLADIWRMEIEPYLEEYFFDQPGKVDPFRWRAVAQEILA